MKVVSKCLQIKEIWSKKSAGNISLVSWGINIYTCVSKFVPLKNKFVMPLALSVGKQLK
jgi:hypothetical protein